MHELNQFLYCVLWELCGCVLCKIFEAIVNWYTDPLKLITSGTMGVRAALSGLLPLVSLSFLSLLSALHPHSHWLNQYADSLFLAMVKRIFFFFWNNGGEDAMSFLRNRMENSCLGIFSCPCIILYTKVLRGLNPVLKIIQMDSHQNKTKGNRLKTYHCISNTSGVDQNQNGLRGAKLHSWMSMEVSLDLCGTRSLKRDTN